MLVIFSAGGVGGREWVDDEARVVAVPEACVVPEVDVCTVPEVEEGNNPTAVLELKIPAALNAETDGGIVDEAR